MQTVLLVDKLDNVIGVAEKMKAHQDGTLHRAFSILIFNSKGEILLQQRSLNKYHSAGLWTNACCGHPTNSENTLQDALERLKFEMGFITEIKHDFTFEYFAKLNDGLFENEIDHVFVGNYDGAIPFNTDEVMACRWISLAQLKTELLEKPDSFTFWFRMIIPMIVGRNF